MRWWTVGALAAAILVPAHAQRKYDAGDVAQLLEIAQAEKEPEGRRAQAIRELEHTDERSQLSTLRRLLREERSLDIRLSAACTLAALGDRKAPRDLLLVTAYDGSRTPHCTRSDVLLSLARIGDPAGELHLEKALRDPAPQDEPFYYADACKALAILNTPGARKLLLRALRDSTNPAVRAAAVPQVAKLASDRKCPERAEAAQAIRVAARTDGDEKVAEEAAAALFWSGLDGAGFFKILEADPDPKLRTRAARVMNLHYLSPARLERLRGALFREKDPDVRKAMQATIDSQVNGAR